jgi:hypothetical protein
MLLHLKSSEGTRYLRSSLAKGRTEVEPNEGRAAWSWRAEVKERTVHGEGLGRNWSGEGREAAHLPVDARPAFLF